MQKQEASELLEQLDDIFQDDAEVIELRNGSLESVIRGTILTYVIKTETLGLLAEKDLSITIVGYDRFDRPEIRVESL